MGTLNKFGLCAAVFATAMVVGKAQAQVTYYIGGTGGWTYLPSATDHTAVPPDYHVSYKDGYDVGSRIGLQWGQFRLEEEYQYSLDDNDHFDVGGKPVSNLTGNRHSHAILTNAIYDFPVSWPVTPHIGVGIGALEAVDRVKDTPSTVHLINYDWGIGVQAIAGLRYDFNQYITGELDYRFLSRIGDLSFTVLGPSPPIRYTTPYETHSLVASLTFHCCAPAPAAPPVAAAPPPPPPAKVFIVFFDWDKDTITPDGQSIIQQAADAYKAGASVQMQIQVIGYTDRSGSAGYNQRLSERRANNVAKALAALGVPQSSMVVAGRGENDNRVPTADGVREPQNRRVEITEP